MSAAPVVRRALNACWHVSGADTPAVMMEALGLPPDTPASVVRRAFRLADVEFEGRGVPPAVTLRRSDLWPCIRRAADPEAVLAELGVLVESQSSRRVRGVLAAFARAEGAPGT